MRIVVDRDLCIGAASCVVIAGKVFALDDEGKVFILNEKKDEATGEPVETTKIGATGTVVESEQTEEMDPRDIIIEAARSCPVLAIKLFEDDGTEIAL